MAAIESIPRFSQPSLVCDKRDVEQIDRLAECFRRWQSAAAKQFFRKHADEPLLVWYGCDTTPLTTKQTYRMILEHLQVARRGK